MQAPRGIRNNNPGNIRIGAQPWRGLQGGDGAFCIFDTPENGIRAIAKILKSYKARGIYTVHSIISTWAPPSENNTQAYIDSVCRDSKLSETEFVSADEWPQLIAAIIQHENGQQPYSIDTIRAGVALA